MTIFRPILSKEELNNVKDVAIMYDLGHLKSFNSSGRPGKTHGWKESDYTPESKQRSCSPSIFSSDNRLRISA